MKHWEYEQKDGWMWAEDGTCVWQGYSGHKQGLNNPLLQDVPFIGPIPQGEFEFGEPEDHPELGPWAIPIIPLPGTNTFGRSGFFLHGDNSEHNKSGSEGCIATSPKSNRMLISKGDTLTVVAER